MKKSCFKTVEPFATKIIFCIVSIICVGLLACACQNELSIVSPRIQATELQSGTASSTVDSQITGTADPTNGTWLRFTAYNGGTSSVLLTNDDDVAAGIPLSPGQTASIATSLDAWTHAYHFRIYPAQAGTSVSRRLHTDAKHGRVYTITPHNTGHGPQGTLRKAPGPCF